MVIILDSVGDDGQCCLFKVMEPQDVQLERAMTLTLFAIRK